MQTGFDSTSLALYTGLSPCGALAFVLLAVYLLTGRMEKGDRWQRTAAWLVCPLTVTWIGFIASATHLGTPANALYAVANVGSSPLSNEVVATVAFLFCAGVLWLYTFSREVNPALVRMGLGACVCTGVPLLALMSVAYAVPTVPTWNTWLAPANFIAGAVCGGPALASLVLTAVDAERPRWRVGLLISSVVALIIGTFLLMAYVRYLNGVGNNVIPPGGAVGPYPVLIAVHDLLAACGLATMLFAQRTPLDHGRQVTFSAIGCLLVLAGMVAVRLPFYAAYLSVGF